MAEEQRYSPEQVQRLLDQLAGQVSRLDQEMDAARRQGGSELAAALLAHEVCNILTPVKALAQLALARPEDRELSFRALQRIVSGIDRTTDVAGTVIEMTEGRRGAAGSRESTLVLDAAREAIGSLGEDPGEAGITVELRIDPELRVGMSGVALVQVLVNLVTNAVRSMVHAQRGSRVRIEAERFECSTWNTGGVRLAVVDDGPGIDPAVRGRLFEPFFRTAASRQQGGRGLGLAICRQLVASVGGQIEVSSIPGHGACFSMELPGASSAGSRAA